MTNEKSKSAAFIERMEAKRLSRECPYILDMRGKVRADCYPVEFNDRTFHLDDISHTLFRRGLERTGGIFTVGLYEAIINGPHTYRGARRSGAPGPAAAERQSERKGPRAIPFGYSLRRRETRLDLAVPAILSCDDIEFHSTIRNISPSGLGIFTKVAYRFEPGRSVTIDLSALSDGAVAERLRRVPYEIVRVKPHGDSIDLHLKLAGGDAREATTRLLTEVLETESGAGRLDMGDDLSTVAAFFFERIYADNNPRLPIFLAEDDDGELMPETLLLTPNNRTLAERLRHTGRYNLHPLCAPGRLARLQEGRPFTLVLQRCDADTFWSCADFEAPGQWARLLRRAVQERETVIIQVGTAAIDPARLDRILKRNEFIFADAPVESPRIPENIERLRLLVHLTDITAIVSAAFRGHVAPTPLGEYDGIVSHRDTAVTPRRIAEILIGVERREVRYRARTAVEVSFAGQVLEGSTVDISIKGMQVELDTESLPFVRDQDIGIALTSLHEKRPELGLNALRYRVRNILHRDNAYYLMLERIVEGPRDRHWDFFQDLFAKNREKIEQDDGPRTATAAARFYGNIEAAHLVTLPFFVTLDENQAPRIESVGLATTDTGTPARFRRGDGTQAFGVLQDAELTRALAPLSRRNPDPLQLLVRLSETPDGALEAMPFDPSHKRGLDLPQSHLLACIAQPIRPYSEIDLDAAILKIFGKARGKALQLRHTLHKVIAVGEFIDITEALRGGLEERGE